MIGDALHRAVLGLVPDVADVQEGVRRVSQAPPSRPVLLSVVHRGVVVGEPVTVVLLFGQMTTVYGHRVPHPALKVQVFPEQSLTVPLEYGSLQGWHSVTDRDGAPVLGVARSIRDQAREYLEYLLGRGHRLGPESVWRSI